MDVAWPPRGPLGAAPPLPFFFLALGVSPTAFASSERRGDVKVAVCCLFGCRLVPGLRRCSVDPGAADSSKGMGPSRSTR